jgi:hypothetical protein
VIECSNASEWLSTLKSRYDIANTTLNDTPEAFTILYHPSPNRNMMVGRYCRVGKWGIVLCMRKADKTVKYERRNQRK